MDPMKKRYKLMLDPQYREDWTCLKTHQSWMKMKTEMNVAKNLYKNTEHSIQDFSDISDDNALLETISVVNTFDDTYSTHHTDEENCFTEDTYSDGSFTDEGNIEYDTDEDSVMHDANEVHDSEHEELPDNENNDDNSIMFETSALTISDVMLMITAICVRFNLSYEIRKAIVDLIKCLAGPQFKTWSMSKYTLKKKYDPPKNVLSYTFFCNLCKALLLGPISKLDFKNQFVSCKECQQKHKLTMQSQYKFVYIDLQFQLKKLLSNSFIQQSVIEYIHHCAEKRNADGNVTLNDISDSVLYKSLSSKYSGGSDYLLTYNFNTDGMPIFNSSKKSSWPLLLILNEMPPSLRFKHVLLCALWIGDKEPTPTMMNMFLKQFVEQAMQLFEKGITIQNKQSLITFKLLPMCCVVDSVARPIVQNRLQYNGYYGCSWCYARGKYLHGTVRYLFNESSNLRTHETHMIDVREATEFNKCVRGVKGNAILLQLPQFNAVWGFSYEFMHGTLLGVYKQIGDSFTCKDSPIYLTAIQRKEVNTRLTNITPIKKIQRLPRPLTDRCKWKASEWLSWGLFYCLPCLSGIIRDNLLEHLALLVGTLFLLLQNNLSENDLRKCEIDLLRFVAEFQILYGEKCVTFNIHSLLHIVQSIKMVGPLWANSAFVFESTNYDLKQKVSGPKSVDNQICTRYLQKNLFKWQADSIYENFEICGQYYKYLFANRMHSASVKIVDETVLLGNGQPIDNGFMYQRCIYKGELYHTTSYRPEKKTNDSIVQLINNESAQIIAIININDQCYIDVKKINTENAFHTPHIYKVISYGERNIRIPVSNIKAKMLIIKHTAFTYVCRIPNIFNM
ncbi:uncharacterized protein LOC118647030 isoform X2 [Monomorium pharaonis]|nr:uncharacterized protein LOC118645022 isoform X2 [Monomorium pharaonis]XP_036143948.1 uncharacterized protein LOC118645963 isoform X2 [Monomorium pharaonis]XP_036143949.1 uncharacterized protein LOC118645963 isoform X2 [Monomorium pharaonis]XP_036147048.1 uncharacterized protein LOC118647030 isoform X2 [Monomorium pharaonis]